MRTKSKNPGRPSLATKHPRYTSRRVTRGEEGGGLSSPFSKIGKCDLIWRTNSWIVVIYG